MLNFEVASFSNFSEIFKQIHFVTAEAADIDDSIKRKRIQALLKNGDKSLPEKLSLCKFDEHSLQTH